MGALEVKALAARVGGDQHLLLAAKFVQRNIALLQRHTAIDQHGRNSVVFRKLPYSLLRSNKFGEQDDFCPRLLALNLLQ